MLFSCFVARKPCLSHLVMYLTCIFVFQILQIWVNSPHNGSGYFMTGEDSQTEDRFNAKLTTGGLGETGVMYARTGYLGFIKRTDFTQTDGGEMRYSTCLIKRLNDFMSIALVIP